MIRTVNSVEMPTVRSLLIAQGFELTSDQNRCVLTGRHGSDFLPALELVAIDDVNNEPILHQVAQRSPGEWVPCTGVAFVDSRSV